MTHLSIFFNFATLRSNLSSKCPEGDFDICGVIDQVDHGESECEVKTGTGSSFRRHFGEKPFFLGFSRANISVAMGRPIFGAVCYVWGLNIRSHVRILGVLPNIGAASCPSLTPGPKIFAALYTM